MIQILVMNSIRIINKKSYTFNFLLTLIFTLYISVSKANENTSIPRFSKYPIAETGCAVYLPSDPREFQVSHSEDGSEVYTAEVMHGEHYFNVIVVKFSDETAADYKTEADIKEVLTNYLDYLQEVLGVTFSAGYGWGHTQDDYAKAVGVIDYWSDSEGFVYAVKAWCDGKYLSVLSLYGKEDYPIFNVQQLFLNGFRFPQ